MCGGTANGPERSPKSRVAGWFVFKPKIPIWVNFGGHGMANVVIFYDHLEYVLVVLNNLCMAIWYM
jgi:hypothetical protein